MRLPSPSRSLAVLPVAAAVMAGCGGSDGGPASRAGADPASVMPKPAALYLEAEVRPKGDQQEQLRALLGKVLRTEDPGARITAALDKSIQEQDPGKSFDKDVAPWLGDRAAVTVTDLAADEPGYLVAIATRNAGKASAFLASEATEEHQTERSYAGTDYYVDGEDDTVTGMVGGFVVVSGSEAAFKAARDTPDDGGLDDSEAFRDAIGDLPDDRLGSLYLDPKVLGDAAAAGAQDPATAG